MSLQDLLEQHITKWNEEIEGRKQTLDSYNQRRISTATETVNFYQATGIWERVELTSGEFNDVVEKIPSRIQATHYLAWSNHPKPRCSDPTIHLDVQALKPLKVVVSGLTLVAREYKGEWGLAESPVWSMNSPRKWRFVFVGAAGKDLYVSWRKQCLEDPIFKIALANARK